MYQDKSYKYQLDKSSKKYICPRCGKKTFVLYLDETGHPLDESVGRCDRQDKCAFHYAPREYFKDKGTLGETSASNKANRRTTRNKVVEPSYIDASIFKASIRDYEHNSLMRFLHSVFDNRIGSDSVNRIAMEYAVGTSKQFGGSPVFWQIDLSGRIRSGKIMGYNSDNGKRIKEPKVQFGWVHKLMQEHYPEFRLKQSFFGGHRIKYVSKWMDAKNEECKRISISNKAEPIIWLLESEKAVLIVAMALAWIGAENLFIPVASGSCENFNPSDEHKRDPFHAIQLLRNRRIVIFPDEGKFDEWKLKAYGLKGFSSEVYISTVMEKNLHPHPVECAYSAGDAIDDLILAYIRDGKTVEEVNNLIVESYGYQGQYKVV